MIVIKLYRFIATLVLVLVAAPAYAQLPPTTTYGLDFIANNQQTVAPTNQYRLRYNTSTGVLEQSTSGSNYIPVDQQTIYNVLAYGAVCDGTTNNSTAIQNAINAAAAVHQTSNGNTTKGGIVYVPQGICAFASPLDLSNLRNV